MTKNSIRQQIKLLKSSLTISQKAQSEKMVFEKIERLSIYKKSLNILMYNSLPDELPTKTFLEKWGKEKNIFLPRVNGDELEILPYNKSDIKIGAYNIGEPTGKSPINISNIEMIIVPAIAYDHNGNRVGRGKGFYDRLLQHSDAIKVGVGYDFQLIPEIEAIELHDKPVDIIITPSYYINTLEQ